MLSVHQKSRFRGQEVVSVETLLVLGGKCVTLSRL